MKPFVRVMVPGFVAVGQYCHQPARHDEPDDKISLLRTATCPHQADDVMKSILPKPPTGGEAFDNLNLPESAVAGEDKDVVEKQGFLKVVVNPVSLTAGRKAIPGVGLCDTSVVSHRSRPKAPKYKPFMYRGVFRCGECGCFITTETQKGNNYLRCTKRVKKDCSQPYVREESISAQVVDYLRLIALPPEWTDWMIQEIETEQNEDKDSRQDCLQSFRSQIAENDQKLDRLMQAYLDKVLSLDEYRQAKGELIERKQELKEKLTAAEANRANWFEPAIRFVKASKQALLLTENGQESERRDFLRKIGSNLTISDRHLSVKPREPWQLVVDKGPFAQHNAAPSCDDAAFLGEKTHSLNKAERGRFELPLPFRADRFSKPAHSTTLPPLQETSLTPAKPWFPSVFPGAVRDGTASHFTSPDFAEPWRGMRQQ